ncbi:MAG: hypothetical protein ACFFAQ_00485 [Promethearchaeota archaeon]
MLPLEPGLVVFQTEINAFGSDATGFVPLEPKFDSIVLQHEV